ncbi:MAG: hypothetical protein FWF43_01765 [Propionibacteriaceae bacterium]|nr:hypothetical protein [Propionibacteriaceae bacterium]
MHTMRTTITIDKGLLSTAKAAAARDNLTLGQLISDALQHHMADTAVLVNRRVTLPTTGRGGVRPGVNISSNSEIFDLLDDES